MEGRGLRRPQPILSCRVVGILACLALLAAATVTFAQGAQDDEPYDILNRRGPDPVDQITTALHRWSKVFLIVGAALLGVVALKIINPFEVYHRTSEKLLKRAVRGVDELLKRIQEEAATTTSETKEPPMEAGVLAGMAEIAEFDQAEPVPAYVLTVNDLMLDKVRLTLKRLRRFQEGNAQRYRGYMFSVLEGIKTIAEQCAHSGVPSSLAVDVKDYFQDEHRYRAWTKLLRRLGRQGEHKELADSFSLFIRNVREGRSLAPAEPGASTDETTVLTGPPARQIPVALNEGTLPALQKAAAKEAANLVSLVQAGRPLDPQRAWQFEFVQRQQQLRAREEAKKMLRVFLSYERQALPRLTHTRMLPCRTWPHVLYLLGVETDQTLVKRIDDRLLTIQEIIILQKAFLQTFAKRGSLAQVYGQGQDAELMMNLHVVQVRRQALAMLRRCHESEPHLLDRATQELDEQETPQHHEVTRLIRHYIDECHEPPDLPGA
ncbi:MAG: hypothetical protein JW993_15010 [Sedimentisphaerales bacterium]|nr:hypothetical protein [Sedimentisphaerales bacterium]